MTELPAVQHWILCRMAKIAPPARPFNQYVLRGVSYRYEVRPSVGMSMHDPRMVKSLRLFARFFGGNGPLDFEIQQWWMDDPASGESGTRVEVFGPHTVFFRPTEPVRDFVFTLNAVPLVGRYQFRLVPLPSVSNAEPDDDPPEPLAVEFLEVVQP